MIESERFHYNKTLKEIYDYDTCEDGVVKSLDCFDACELLNELNNENERLESENDSLRYTLEKISKDISLIREGLRKGGFTDD